MEIRGSRVAVVRPGKCRLKRSRGWASRSSNPCRAGARAAPDRADGPWTGVILATAGDPRRANKVFLRATRSGSSNNKNNNSSIRPPVVPVFLVHGLTTHLVHLQHQRLSTHRRATRARPPNPRTQTITTTDESTGTATRGSSPTCAVNHERQREHQPAHADHVPSPDGPGPRCPAHTDAVPVHGGRGVGAVPDPAQPAHLPAHRPPGRRGHVLRALRAGPDAPGPGKPRQDPVPEQRRRGGAGRDAQEGAGQERHGPGAAEG